MTAVPCGTVRTASASATITCKNDMLGVGLNWSRPNEGTFGPGPNDQDTGEIYYRFYLLKVLTLTPSWWT
jgi:porin